MNALLEDRLEALVHERAGGTAGESNYDPELLDVGADAVQALRTARSYRRTAQAYYHAPRPRNGVRNDSRATEMLDAVQRLDAALGDDPPSIWTARFEVGENTLTWAFRYALGRRTAAVGDVNDTLAAYWPRLSHDFLRMLVKEINEADARGDLGGPPDIAQWRALRDRASRTLNPESQF